MNTVEIIVAVLSIVANVCIIAVIVWLVYLGILLAPPSRDGEKDRSSSP